MIALLESNRRTVLATNKMQFAGLIGLSEASVVLTNNPDRFTN